jgi:hypothetical protein
VTHSLITPSELAPSRNQVPRRVSPLGPEDIQGKSMPRKTKDSARTEIRGLRTRMELLERELAEQKRLISDESVDAARYRWLRDRYKDYQGEVAFYEHDKGIDYKPRRGTKLDAAIDAAMKEVPK